MQSINKTIICLSLVILVTNSSTAAEPPKNPIVENEVFTFRLIPRSPENITSFYEGRGFPKTATDELEKACFFGGIVRNKGKKVVWLELKNWRFYNDKGEIHRLDRTYWNQRWKELDIPQSYRSTFNWTLLPKVRDLQPHEPVGGNIILPRSEGPFTLEVHFLTGKNKRDGDIAVTFKNIRCAKDKAPGDKTK